MRGDIRDDAIKILFHFFLLEVMSCHGRDIHSLLTFSILCLDFQVLGMGTALKILFSGNTMGLESTVSADYKADFQLTRTEIVALFNAFSR